MVATLQQTSLNGRHGMVRISCHLSFIKSGDIDTMDRRVNDTHALYRSVANHNAED